MNLYSKCSSFIFLISWSFYLQISPLVFAKKPCKLDNIFLNDCGGNATCIEQGSKKNEGFCDCTFSFHLENGKCVPNPDPTETSSSLLNEEHPPSNEDESIALWFLIPCFLLILTGVAFFLTKRLKLIEKVYQFRVRRYNTVFVTSLQDDDAPIT